MTSHGIWRLFVTNPECDWQPIDRFLDFAGAADRIREMEGYPATGIFLEFYIDPQTSDMEALSRTSSIPDSATGTSSCGPHSKRWPRSSAQRIRIPK